MNDKMFRAMGVVDGVIWDGTFRCGVNPESRTLRYLDANCRAAIVESLAKHWGVDLDA